MNVEKELQTDEVPFHQLLTGAQSSLYAFICSLMGGAAHSRDILQETNLLLWEKAEQYDRSRDFLPWAFQFAHLQVLAFRKRQHRDRLLFDDSLLATLADEFGENVKHVDARLEALDTCVGKLPDAQRDLIRRYYERGNTVEAISKSLGKSANAVAAQLYRIRKTLGGCVQRAMKAGVT